MKYTSSVVLKLWTKLSTCGNTGKSFPVGGTSLGCAVFLMFFWFLLHADVTVTAAQENLRHHVSMLILLTFTTMTTKTEEKLNLLGRSWTWNAPTTNMYMYTYDTCTCMLPGTDLISVCSWYRGSKVSTFEINSLDCTVLKFGKRGFQELHTSDRSVKSETWCDTLLSYWLDLSPILKSRRRCHLLWSQQENSNYGLGTWAFRGRSYHSMTCAFRKYWSVKSTCSTVQYAPVVRGITPISKHSSRRSIVMTYWILRISMCGWICRYTNKATLSLAGVGVWILVVFAT